MSIRQDANGRTEMTSIINPLPIVDDWAVLSDGTIAVVRGQDYHVDFYTPDGKKSSTAKIAYEWQRLSDEDKVKFVDSTKVAMERNRAQMAAGGAGAQPGGGGVFGGGAFGGGAGGGGAFGGGAGGGGAFGGGAGGGTPMIVMRMDGPGGGGPPGSGGERRVEVTGGPPAVGMPILNFISPSELPDYKPVFGAGAVRADMDGRIWVRTIPTKPTPGGAVYDIIDRSGAVIDRVQVPAGAVIAGFGKGGVVYLGTRDASGTRLHRAMLK